jgi:hypothetical protein
VTLWQKGTDELKKKLEGLEFHLIDWQHRAEGERIRASEVRPLPSSTPSTLTHTMSHSSVPYSKNEKPQ